MILLPSLIVLGDSAHTLAKPPPFIAPQCQRFPVFLVTICSPLLFEIALVGWQLPGVLQAAEVAKRCTLLSPIQRAE